MRSLLLVALVAACHAPVAAPPGSPPPPPASPPPPPSACTLAIEGFLSTDPAKLRPLPPDCTVDEIGRSLRPTDVHGARSYLGTDYQTYDLTYFVSDAFPVVSVWADQAGHVILIEADDPPASIDRYLDALGAPDALLDYLWGTGTVPEGEQVWLDHGVSIVYRAEYTNAVIHVGIFSPGRSLDDYTRTLKYDDEEWEDEG